MHQPESVAMTTDIKTQIIQELPDLLENDPAIRQSVWRMITPYFAPRQETDSRFDQMMAELRQMREESERKWQEQKQESERKRQENQQRWEENWAELQRMREESERKWQEQKQESERKWQENQQELRQMREESDRKWQATQQELHLLREESDRRWEENQQRWEENWAKLQRMQEESERNWQQQHETNRQLHKKMDRVDATLGAIGARWGTRSEASFRNALRALLQEVADVQVQQVDIVDETGEVFGYPANVELDIVIHNGKLIVCEIKSSVSRAEVREFHDKIQFYKKHRQQEIDRTMLISPMIDAKAKEAAQALNITLYSHVDDAFPEQAEQG